MQKEVPQNRLSRADGAAFLVSLGETILEKYPELDDESWQYREIQEFLWRAKGTPLEAELRSFLLPEKPGNKDSLRALLSEAEERVDAMEKTNEAETQDGEE